MVHHPVMIYDEYVTSAYYGPQTYYAHVCACRPVCRAHHKTEKDAAYCATVRHDGECWCFGKDLTPIEISGQERLF